MLTLLQRHGRLIDFLMENTTAYVNTQIGAAVRSVHASCRQALERYVFISIVAARPGLIAVVLWYAAPVLRLGSCDRDAVSMSCGVGERRTMFTSARPAATARSESR
jgi:hypothetical protein